MKSQNRRLKIGWRPGLALLAREVGSYPLRAWAEYQPAASTATAPAGQCSILGAQVAAGDFIGKVQVDLTG
jgi:hypothetical protein